MNNHIDLLKQAYNILANIHNQWHGRNTQKGQALLIKLRDTIAEETNTSPQDVQDEASNHGPLRTTGGFGYAKNPTPSDIASGPLRF